MRLKSDQVKRVIFLVKINFANGNIMNKLVNDLSHLCNKCDLDLVSQKIDYCATFITRNN